MRQFYIDYFLYVIGVVGVGSVAGLIYVNVMYWRDLNNMTPDEYRMFKDEESKDMQNW